jgi:conserved oligomeric Golgi complex subunit 8
MQTDEDPSVVLCRLTSLIDSLDRSNTSDYLRQLTDLNRVHLFDVVMQYRALFTDSSVKADNGSAVPMSSAGTKAADHAGNSREIFGWVHHRVQFYVEQMGDLLPLCVSLQAQSMLGDVPASASMIP